ncbi:MAG TPA: energy transducer TonB [Bacteroidia bacterium]|nr:energy transducer TonB [Bacteroidia bacterium]
MLAQTQEVQTIHIRKKTATQDSLTPPEFPGGDAAMQVFIQDHALYPDSARKAGIKGFVVVVFNIGAEGSVSDPVIKEGLGYGCDESALKMVRAMPRWKPAVFKETPVALQYELRVAFPSK